MGELQIVELKEGRVLEPLAVLGQLQAAINALGFLIFKQGYLPRETQVEKFLTVPFPTRD